MALIEFKNLPDTSTPLNAENLNNNFNELENKMNTINNALEKINNDLNNYIIYEKLTKPNLPTPITINSNNNVSGVQFPTQKDGYEVIGIVSVDTDNNNITLQKFSFTASTVYVTFRNTTTSSQSFTPTITCLYKKNR